MNSKRTIAGLAAATALLAVSGGANAEVYDYAKVISSQPIIRYVTVKTPVRECWQDTEYYTVYNRPPGLTGSTLAGALIGGVIGHQFGSGHGNDAATIAGTVIGGSIGAGAAHRRAGVGYGHVQHSRPVERCETHYRDQREKRVDGYNVVYLYNGQKYATKMPYDPGKKIKVRIDIRPAG